MHYARQDTLSPNDCLIVGALEDAALSKKLPLKALHPLQHSLKKSNDLRVQTNPDSTSFLLVHCGAQASYTQEKLLKYLKTCFSFLATQTFAQVTFAFPPLPTHAPDDQLALMVQQIDALCYQLNEFKTDAKTLPFTHINFFLPGATDKGLHTGKIMAEALRFTRYLADLPANICTPTFLAKQAKGLAKENPTLHCTHHSLADIKKLNMGGLLAVTQGSEEPPCFIELHYQGAEASVPPIVLIGKGVTFDAGGISLKPPANMNEMKYDMAGAATVLGALKASAALQLPINLIGLAPCTENLPSGRAVRPGDIITMMSGQTVEVLNTDAEGRLILADALTYAARFKPRYVIDIATLTGAVIMALGQVASGLMTPDDALADQLTQAAKASGDKLWRLPLWKDYEESLDSPIADMINASFERSAGSITAGLFLAKFARDYRWAHLDIAGTAWKSGSKRASTGRPLPLLMAFLQRC